MKTKDAESRIQTTIQVHISRKLGLVGRPAQRCREALPSHGLQALGSLRSSGDEVPKNYTLLQNSKLHAAIRHPGHAALQGFATGIAFIAVPFS